MLPAKKEDRRKMEVSWVLFVLFHANLYRILRLQIHQAACSRIFPSGRDIKLVTLEIPLPMMLRTGTPRLTQQLPLDGVPNWLGSLQLIVWVAPRHEQVHGYGCRVSHNFWGSQGRVHVPIPGNMHWSKTCI